MGIVFWLTGLSGSGKTTITLELKKRLTSMQKTVKIIDGDVIRNTLHKHFGFSREYANSIAESCIELPVHALKSLSQSAHDV